MPVTVSGCWIFYLFPSFRGRGRPGRNIYAFSHPPVTHVSLFPYLLSPPFLVSRIVYYRYCYHVSHYCAHHAASLSCRARAASDLAALRRMFHAWVRIQVGDHDTIRYCSSQRQSRLGFGARSFVLAQVVEGYN